MLKTPRSPLTSAPDLVELGLLHAQSTAKLGTDGCSSSHQPCEKGREICELAWVPLRGSWGLSGEENSDGTRAELRNSHSPRAALTQVSIFSYQDKWTQAVPEVVQAIQNKPGKGVKTAKES